MKVVFPDYINLTLEAKTKLQQSFDIDIYNDIPKTDEETLRRIKSADIVTANYIDLTGELIRKAPKLKFIISPAVGYEWIDIKAATEKKIRVLNCPTYNSQAVAEHAIGLMFAVKRKYIQGHNSILKGEFDSKRFVGTEVMNKHLLTIGHGNIGTRILRMAKGLGMLTSYVDTKTSKSVFKS